jgi:hypothetical protein
MKEITYADVMKVRKTDLIEAYKEFSQNPSAENFARLESAMLAYQDICKR